MGRRPMGRNLFVLAGIETLTGSRTNVVLISRSYTFHFVDSGLYLFDPFEYYVDGGAVRDFGDFTIINATKLD